MLSTSWALPGYNNEQDRHLFPAEDTFKKTVFFSNNYILYFMFYYFQIIIDCDECYNRDKHNAMINDREQKCFFS